jgi:hypothetical protein
MGKIAMAPRVEYLYDNTGLATGYRQDLKMLGPGGLWKAGKEK